MGIALPLQKKAIYEDVGTRLRRKACALIILLGMFLGVPSTASAIVFTPDLEVHLLRSVSTNWQTVSLTNTYTNAIPICTYNLVSFVGTNPNYAHPPAVVRIRNITSNSFDVRIQGWEDGPATTGDVHCLVTDEGIFKLPNGTIYEAHTVLSDKTSGQYSTDGKWIQSILEDVSASITHTYTNHVVLGQVISYNDNRASVFHTTDCDARQNEPFMAGHADGICVGKHIGMIPGSRNSETIGYLVAEAGGGILNNIGFELARGADSVAGNSAANTGYPYALSGDYNIGITSQVGEDGGNGSWSVLYGADPLPPNTIMNAVDEEIYAGDTTRNHTREYVDYWVFGTAELTLAKKVINDHDGSAVASDFTLTAAGPGTISGMTGDASITDAAVAPGTFNLSESGPAGYAGTWSCTEGTLVGASLTLNAGDDAECTLVNDDIYVPPPEAFLTLEKKIVNDHGGTAVVGDFTLEFSDGAGVSGAGVSGDAPITGVSVPPGIYSLTESVVTGYKLTQITCTGLDPDGTDGLKIKNGEKVTCTFVNDDNGVDLEVRKSVNDTSPNVGDTLTFTIKVANNGPDTATDFHIKDVVKPGFNYVGGSMTGGNTMVDTSPTGTGLDWEITTLAPGASVVLTFQATVLAP